MICGTGNGISFMTFPVLSIEREKREISHGTKAFQLIVDLRRVNLEDAAASEHGDIQVAFGVDCHTVWNVGLNGSVVGDVSQNLLAADVTGLDVVHVLLDVQVIGVDVVESVGLVVEGHAV